MKNIVQLVLMAAIALLLYLTPAIVAFSKRRKKARLILLLNLLGGWTVLGWGAALAWAFEEDPKPQIVPWPHSEDAPKQPAHKRAA